MLGTIPECKRNQPLVQIQREVPVTSSDHDRFIGDGIILLPDVQIKQIGKIMHRQGHVSGLMVKITFCNKNNLPHVRILNSSVTKNGTLCTAPKRISITRRIDPDRARDFLICHGRVTYLVTIRVECVRLMVGQTLCKREFRTVTSVREYRGSQCVTKRFPVAQA